jgi:hypothetical protein
MSQSTDAPTQKQLRYLRLLAKRTGQTFQTPQSRAEASREIRRLRRQPRSHRGEVAAERLAISRELAERPEDGVAPRSHEVAGFGSSARWAAYAGGRVSSIAAPEKPAAPPYGPPPTTDTAQSSGKGKAHPFAGYRVGDERRLIVVQRIRGAIRLGDVPAGGDGARYLLADELQSCGELDALVAEYTSRAAELGVSPASAEGVRRGLERLR